MQLPLGNQNPRYTSVFRTTLRKYMIPGSTKSRTHTLIPIEKNHQNKPPKRPRQMPPSLQFTAQNITLHELAYESADVATGEARSRNLHPLHPPSRDLSTLLKTRRGSIARTRETRLPGSEGSRCEREVPLS
jgi:hypothetical protein